MDDIYDDLNNYEDVNALEELRSENHELKVKLEEHSAAMAKLQKDYDTLEVEFKKLEHNYSSLLITARAEIQRKTQRIVQLNTEKDLMVLDAVKRGKNIRRNFNQGVKYPGKMNFEKAPGKTNNTSKGDNVLQKNVDTKHERCENPVLPTKETILDFGTHNKKLPENAGTKVELADNVKENIAQHKTELKEPPKTSASSNEDRRKFKPAGRMPIAKFSSEDELEQNYVTKDKDTRTDKFDRRNINRMLIDRHTNKTSEISSVDERGYNYHESTSRDIHKGRSSRYNDNSSCRGREKYDASLKYRKGYSPERGQKRPHREYQDDYPRHEQGRRQGRSLESPPPESSSRYQRRESDHRPDYDRYTHDREKNRHHYDDKYSTKYRLKDDEPRTKRQKRESYGNPDAHSKENRRHYHDHEKESMDSQLTPSFSPHGHDTLRFSCQSPDYIHTDEAFEKPIKEIMATAATPLDDPRVTSKRYVYWKENGKETLSAAAGRNIDIRSINKALWNIKPVGIPAALMRRPSQCSDELTKDICMDINNPVTNLNLSMESGEIRETDKEINIIRSKPKDTQDNKINKQIPVDLLKQATSMENISKQNIARYRIPKMRKNIENTQSKMDVPIIEIEYAPQRSNVYKTGEVDDSFPKESPTHKHKYSKREDFLHNKINYSKKEDKKKSRSKERDESQDRATLTKMAIVADDLELSDDNSEHMDTNRGVVVEMIQKNCEIPLNINETRTDDTVNNGDNKTRTKCDNADIGGKIDTAEIKKVAEQEKCKESDSTKKQKIKRKKSKCKEISKDSLETKDASVAATESLLHVTEKKIKSKKESESKTKETKEKFSDLFGDSSSLMTPEDLGIPSYLPISEDAQDAVDMKISQIIDSALLIDKRHGDPGDEQTRKSVEVTIQETTGHYDIPKDVSQTSNMEVVADKEITEKMKPSKRNKEIIDPNELPSPIIYENLNPETDSNEPNIVKTVIISTGKQPEITYDNNLEITKPATDGEVSAKQNTTNINLFPAIQGFKSNILKALATSTPQKERVAVNPIEVDGVGTTSIICDPDVSKAVASITNAEQVVHPTVTNTLETNDAPDVRIFVKRRRKGVKRPPMT